MNKYNIRYNEGEEDYAKITILNNIANELAEANSISRQEYNRKYRGTEELVLKDEAIAEEDDV